MVPSTCCHVSQRVSSCPRCLSSAVKSPRYLAVAPGEQKTGSRKTLGSCIFSFQYEVNLLEVFNKENSPGSSCSCFVFCVGLVPPTIGWHVSHLDLISQTTLIFSVSAELFYQIITLDLILDNKGMRYE